MCHGDRVEAVPTNTSEPVILATTISKVGDSNTVKRGRGRRSSGVFPLRFGGQSVTITVGNESDIGAGKGTVAPGFFGATTADGSGALGTGVTIGIPLLIRHPQGHYAGVRVEALVQTHDVLPTVLDIMGLAPETEAMHGRSVWPAVAWEKEAIRNYCIVGYHQAEDRCVRDGEWSYIHRPDGEHELYNLLEDPQERENLIQRHPEKAQELAGHLARYFRIAEPKISSLQLRYELSGTAIR